MKQFKFALLWQKLCCGWVHEDGEVLKESGNETESGALTRRTMKCVNLGGTATLREATHNEDGFRQISAAQLLIDRLSEADVRHQTDGQETKPETWHLKINKGCSNCAPFYQWLLCMCGCGGCVCACVRACVRVCLCVYGGGGLDCEKRS